MSKHWIYTPIQEAKSSKRSGNLAILILGYIFLAISQSIGTFVWYLPIGTTVKTSLEMIVGFGLTILAVKLWIEKFEGRPFKTIGLYRKNAFKDYFIGILIGAFMFSGVMILLFLTGNAIISQNPSIKTGINALPYVLILIPGWIIQSGTEEVLTRGWFLSTLSGKYNPLVGIIASSGIFALLHLANPGITLLAVINIFLVGVAFVAMCLYFNNIWVACGAHFSWNLIQGNIFGCPVSGNITGGASFIVTSLTGKSIFTGGNFGPEAGLMATIIILVTIVTLFILINRKKHKN